LRDEDGQVVSEIERDDIAWSNELVAHVIELKTNGPATSLLGLFDRFQQSVSQINDQLAKHGACLLPSAMHPWMDPEKEMTLWPHDFSPVYQTFNRIFDCKGHGWSNLQSMHINLPFCGDSQFASLHAAIRLMLPILPAIAASSPIVDRKLAGNLDHRLEVYRNNSRVVPSVAGMVIPEAVFSSAEYHVQILQNIYQSMAELDPEGILRDEWCNSRGAIARFQRNAIEIRVLDVQECPGMDLAIADLVIAVLKRLTDQKWTKLEEQKSMPTDELSVQFLKSIVTADETEIVGKQYLKHFGIEADSISVNQLWRHLADCVSDDLVDPKSSQRIEVILQKGPLARRILRAVGGELSSLESVYHRLANCLASGVHFE